MVMGGQMAQKMINMDLSHVRRMGLASVEFNIPKDPTAIGLFGAVGIVMIADDEQLFSWAPKRSAGWLSKLHRYNIGNCVYYAQLDEEYHQSETGHIDKNNLKKVKNAHQADCEVLIASYDNIKNLKEQVNIVGSDQLEKYVFSGIIRSMIKIMETKADTKEFIFILWF